ncbi:hypothetical protein BE20_24940 [Sorangium cellulosum]|uniref:Capsid protein n=1 Tax=Sorangium cellulosum TaxID=56 RepID=A0A150S5R0_SORCE|nr:hypothetical protein BE20_24940 [Sorangium cellulosum]KYF89271.1 hypothetical protein BE18_22830 [Sorangium cellulosum]
MADTLQTLALIVLAQNYRGDIVRQVNRQSVALKVLPFVRGEGKNVAFVPEGSGVVAENYAEGADAENFGSDSQVGATLHWAMYRANFHVSGLAEATAATSATPEGNLRLWARNMVNGAAALASLINGAIYTGAGTGTLLTGFDAAIGSASNTYAGIDRSQVANAFFRPNVFAPGSATALTFDLLRSDLSTIYQACGTRPDVAFVHPNVYNKIGALFDAQKFYMVPTQQEIVTSRGKVSLEGGPGAISFEGCKFIEDKDATDGKIYYVNTNHARIEYLPLDLSTIPGLDDEVMDITADDGFGVTPLGIRLEMLSKTGDSDKAQMKTYLQLVVDRPNACGIRSNIA